MEGSTEGIISQILLLGFLLTSGFESLLRKVFNGFYGLAIYTLLQWSRNGSPSFTELNESNVLIRETLL